MTRLLVHVEGQTEESFVAAVLAPYLQGRGFSSVRARLLGNARRRGGIAGWPPARRDVLRHLHEDRGLVVSTMVDYYGLPNSDDDRAWPGRAEASGLPSADDKAETVEAALSADVRRAMGAGFDPRRFVPYLSMHEFEALPFSDCERFGEAIGEPGLAPRFQAIRDAFRTPEEIDDSPRGAPSKRIEALVPGYRKPLLGTLAVLAVGLERVRAECPRFSRWLDRLEALSAGA